MKSFAALLIAVTMAALGSATSASVNTARAVVRPKILQPTTGTVWVVGTKQNVTWDTTGAGADPNPTEILLGHFAIGSDSEHLDTDHPLATGVSLSAGTQEITVPDVPAGSRYFI
ncbi:hypothetical protein BC834DRAFT_791004, partial [Gloeopeniophorella convolvens]